MNKFRNAYQEAVDAVPVPQFDTEGLQEELIRRQRRELRRRKALVKGGAAAAIFLLCGVGTATAKNYIRSTIEIGGNGFTVTGSEEDAGEPFSEVGGGISRERVVPGEDCFIEEETVIEETVYADMENYLEQSAAAEKLPDISFLEEVFPDTEVGVLDVNTSISVRLRTEDKFFFLMQYDHREVVGYGSATAYMGESVNERNYINSQGLNYVVFDTMGEEGKIESTHAVISVNGRDLTLDFGGFEEEEVEEILNRLDLTFYFCE